MGKGKNRSPREKQRARRAGESDRRREGVGRASLEREKIKNKIKSNQKSTKSQTIIVRRAIMTEREQAGGKGQRQQSRSVKIE